MSAMTQMAQALQAEPVEHEPDGAPSRTERIRRELRDNGPATAKQLAQVSGLGSSGMVAPLIAREILSGQIWKKHGRYVWNHQFVAKPIPRGDLLSEMLQWHEARHGAPDAELTVLVRLRNASEEVWLGYWSGEQWVDIDGQPVEVVRWAAMPRGGEV